MMSVDNNNKQYYNEDRSNKKNGRLKNLHKDAKRILVVGTKFLTYYISSENDKLKQVTEAFVYIISASNFITK